MIPECSPGSVCAAGQLEGMGIGLDLLPPGGGRAVETYDGGTHLWNKFAEVGEVSEARLAVIRYYLLLPHVTPRGVQSSDNGPVALT